MSTQPKPTCECTHALDERETACADGMCPICSSAALAAERENVVLATQMVHIESKRANTTEHTLEAAYANHRRDMECTSNNYECELNAKLEQINQQAGTIKELSEALDFYCEQSDDGHRAVAALSKLGYPLPEGKK